MTAKILANFHFDFPSTPCQCNFSHVECNFLSRKFFDSIVNEYVFVPVLPVQLPHMWLTIKSYSFQEMNITNESNLLLILLLSIKHWLLY